MKHNQLNTTSLSTGFKPIVRPSVMDITYQEVEGFIWDKNMREFDRMMTEMKAQKTGEVVN